MLQPNSPAKPSSSTSDSEFKPFPPKNMPKLLVWRLAVTMAGSRFLPLPSLTFDDIPYDQQILIDELYNSRDWERCANCDRRGDEYRLRRCADCGNLLKGRRALYCSRKCQWQNWPNHRPLCRMTYEVKLLKDAVASGLEEQTFRNCVARWPRRESGMRVIIAWLFDQVVSTQRIDHRGTYLLVNCTTQKRGLGNLIVTSYTINPISHLLFECAEPEHLLPSLKPPDQRDVAAVQISIDHRMVHEPLLLNVGSTLDEDLPKWKCEQWPWVFASMLLMGDTNGALSMFKLQDMLAVLEPLSTCKNPANPIREFKVPADLKVRQRWELPNLDKWQEIVGNVIAF